MLTCKVMSLRGGGALGAMQGATYPKPSNLLPVAIHDGNPGFDEIMNEEVLSVCRGVYF